MFNKQTTVILGAGASINHGFPLGQALMSDIVNGLSNSVTSWESRFGDRTGTDFNGSDPSWLKFRYWNLLDMLQAGSGISLGFDLQTVKDFISLAGGQTHTSIDRFLRDNPRFSAIGRYTIALEICSKHWRESSNGQRNLVQLDYSAPQNLDWVRSLVNRIREGASNAHQLTNNRLYVVTFNYDNSLERCLDAQFDNTELHRGAKWQDCLQVLHVYGQVANTDPNNFSRQQFLDDVSKSAAQIDVIDQILKAQEFQERISKIQSAIGNSSKVVIAGFSFDEANVKLLGLGPPLLGSKLFVHNFKGDRGIERVLDGLNVPNQNRFGPQASKEISIAEADEIGLFQPD